MDRSVIFSTQQHFIVELFIIDCPREGIRGNKAEWNSMLSRLRLLNNYMLRQLGYIGINAELCNLDSRNLYFINSLFPERNERELYLYSKRQGYESMGSFIAFCHTNVWISGADHDSIIVVPFCSAAEWWICSPFTHTICK